MKLDKIFQEAMSQGDVASEDINIGKLNGLLIVGGMSVLNKLTVKMRDKNSTHVLVNRMTITAISDMTDFNYGFRTDTGVNVLWKQLIATNVLDATFEANVTKWTNFLECSYIDLGHITLGPGKELEVSIEYGNSVAQTVRVYSVHFNDAPDKYLIYDNTTDKNVTIDKVREVWVNLGEYCMSDDGLTVKQFDAQIDVEGGRTYLLDTFGIAAASNTFGKNETIFEKQVFRIFREVGPLPASIRLKFSHNLTAVPEVYFVRELVPESVSDSTLQQLTELREKVAKLEREDPAQAKAYRHAGAIVKAEQLEAVQKEAEKSAEKDKKETS